MYFEPYLVTSLRLYKWHLFNELSGVTSRLPYICCNVFSSLPPVLLFRSLFWKPIVSIFLFFSSSAAKFPDSFGMAKVVIFLTLSSFYLNFFLFLNQTLILLSQETTLLLYPLQINLLPIPFHVFPSSEAGCKSRKNIATAKLILH